MSKGKILVKISSPAMGDTLCSTPTIRKVSNSYGFKIDVMTRRPDIFENNLYINKILEFTEDDVEGYDEVFETYNQWIKLNKNMSNSEFYDKPMEIKLMNFDARQLHAMGVGITLYPEEMHYDYLPNDQTEDSQKITKDFLVFHITESWPSRTWDPKKWQRLVDLVTQNTDFKIVTVGKSHLESTYHGDMKKGIIDLDNIDYIFRPGDFLSWDMGVGYLNFCTDFKRNAYILKDDETNAPAGLKRAWLNGLNAREIIRKTFKSGLNARQSLKNIVNALEKEGYVYTPSMDRGTQYSDLMIELGNSDKFGFTIDMHATGNTSVGDVTSGPSIAPWRVGRAHLIVEQNYIFALEFEINAWIPEWGRRISIPFEDNAIVTNNGVEYMYPPHEKIILITKE